MSEVELLEWVRLHTEPLSLHIHVYFLLGHGEVIGKCLYNVSVMWLHVSGNCEPHGHLLETDI